MLGNSVKNGRKNLYLHPKPFNTIFKSYWYLMSLSCRGPINPSTPTFPISIWQKQLEIYLLFQMSRINGYNNLYLYNKLFKITLKPNSYLASIFCQGLVNSSTLTFPNIHFKKTVGNLYVVSNATEKSCNNLCLLLKVFHRISKLNSYLMSISRRAPVNL